MAALQPGDRAPDFEVPACTGDHKHRVKLSDFRGHKNVVLAFHPLNWTPVWVEQTSAYQRDLARFAEHDAQVVGMSCDSVFSHVAWQKYETGKLEYPIGSDFYPHGAVAERFGVFRSSDPLAGINERAVFVIDKDGIIRYTKVYELGDIPDNEEVFAVLRELGKVAAR